MIGEENIDIRFLTSLLNRGRRYSIDDFQDTNTEFSSKER